MPKLYPLDTNQATLFTIFDSSSHSESLPTHPYCTDNLEQGIYPRVQRIAVTKRYMQLNPPHQQHWLVFDVDRPHSAYAWYDVNLPTPFAVVVNESNTHCHIVYALESPVCTSDLAHEKPLRYLAAIQRAYTEKLQADVNYSGLIAKNPFNLNHWHVIPTGLNVRYTLDELAEWVSLSKVSKASYNASEAVALGRNCALFDELRLYAYKTIRKYRQGEVMVWCNHILDKALAFNTFNEPLQHNEVKGIAKSVANWVWKKMGSDSQSFIEKQRERGRKGGIAKGAANHNKRLAAELMREQGNNMEDIATVLEVSRMTLHRWFNNT